MGGGCGVSVSAWQLDLVRGSSGQLQCQGDWVYGEMLPEETPTLCLLWSCLGVPQGPTGFN